MLLARGGKVLYVANANRNTVTVIDTEAGKAIETIGTAIDPRAPPGSTPNSLALSRRRVDPVRRQRQHQQPGRRQRQGTRRQHAAGLHPDGLVSDLGAVRRDGKTIYVANGKGEQLAGQPRRAQPAGPGGRSRSIREYIARPLPGNALDHSDARPDADGGVLPDGLRVQPAPPGTRRPCRASSRRPGTPSPARVGDPSPIKYCRLHHQGEPHLRPGLRRHAGRQRRPESVPVPRGGHAQPSRAGPRVRAARQLLRRGRGQRRRPRMVDGRLRHRLRREDLAARLPRRSRGVPYPSEGEFADRPAGGGYLWDRAAEKGVSYRSYGEFVENGKTPDDPGQRRVKALQGHFDPLFRSFDLDYPDVKRAERFLEELAGFEKAGEMPRLSILRLPNDHTSGTSPASRPSTASSPTTTWRWDGSSRGSARAGSGSRWPSSWSRTTRRTARTTSTRTAPSPWSSARTSSGTRRFDDVLHLVDAADDGADPGPGADEPVRRRGPADVSTRSRPRPTSRPTTTARPAST